MIERRNYIMKNTYVTPEVEIISVGATSVLDGSIGDGDIDVNVGNGFF